MIQTLRRRFIAVTMLAVFLVLVVLMGTLNIVNYRTTAERSDMVISTIVKNNGKYPMPKPKEHHHPKPQAQPRQHTDNEYRWDDRGERQKEPPTMGTLQRWRYFLQPQEWKEMPFEMRYFTIFMNAKTHEVTNVNSEKINSVTESEACELAKSLADKNKTKGYAGNFRYCVVTKNGTTMVVCLERTRELSSFYTLLTTTLMLSVLSLLFIWLLVFLFSRRAVRPIAESYEKQKEFITNAGHELKTPLAIIESCTEVVEMENGESKWTDGIHEQVKRLTTMTEDLVTLSRMDESAMNLDKRKLNFSEIASDTLSPFTLLAEEQGKKLNLYIAPDVLINGNERTLKQLCSILADNAVKYSTPDSSIDITLSKKGHRISLESRNKSEGLKKGNYSHLFDRFYRGDTSHNSKSGGYGIGLSMAQSIVQGHGGKITAVSRDGESLEILASIPDNL